VSGENITVTVELTDGQATWTDVRQSAVDDDEAYLMQEAFNEMRQSLADAGYSPR
jgi:hypothetical protein